MVYYMKVLDGRGEVSPLYHLTRGPRQYGVTEDWRTTAMVNEATSRAFHTILWRRGCSEVVSRTPRGVPGSTVRARTYSVVSVTGDVRMLTRLSADIWGAEPSVSDLQLSHFPRIGYKISLSFPLFIGIRYQTVHYFLLIILFLFYVPSIFVWSTNFLLSFFIRYSFFSLLQIFFRYQFFFLFGSFNST